MSHRLVFAGTPGFALPSLSALVDAGRVPVAVLTQPDRPAGRGRRLTAGPVRRFAEARGIPVLQPASLRDPAVLAGIGRFRPDALVVAAYGLLLPQAVLDLPPHGALNIHASLLPRWRGAAPVQAAILAGDRQTGVSLMRMEAGLDSGPVYCRRTVPLGDRETAGQLTERLAGLGAALLIAELDRILAGECTPVPQDEDLVTLAPKLRTADARLDWALPAVALARRVRAFDPAPGAWFELDGERLKCWRAEACAGGGGPPGTVLAAGPDGIDVACGDGSLRMAVLQRAGRGRVSARELADRLPLTGRRLGS